VKIRRPNRRGQGDRPRLGFDPPIPRRIEGHDPSLSRYSRRLGSVLLLRETRALAAHQHESMGGPIPVNPQSRIPQQSACRSRRRT
jgi:hypothetical protein